MTSIDYTLVETQDQLRSIEPDLNNASSLGIALEYDDYYNYELSLNLLQLSTTDQIYLIDVQNVDIGSLAPIFADPNTIKIFYAAMENIRHLQTNFGWNIRSIIDLQTIYKLGSDSDEPVPLETVVEDTLGHKLVSYTGEQPINWTIRPFPTSMLEHAAQRVKYLHQVLVQLQQRLSPVEQQVLEVHFLQHPLSPDLTLTPLMYAFQLCHDYKINDPGTRLLIYRLIEFREEIGEKHDIGAKAVLNEDQLRVLVSRKPRSVEELQKRDLFTGKIKDYHQQILSLIKSTSRNPSNIDPDGTYANLDEKFKKFYPYHNYLDKNYEWIFDISLSSYRNRRGITRIIHDMIAWKVEDRFMPYLLTEALRHQLAANPTIRLDLLRPKIDACDTVEDIISFIYEQVELLYAMTEN